MTVLNRSDLIEERLEKTCFNVVHFQKRIKSGGLNRAVHSFERKSLFMVLLYVNNVLQLQMRPMAARE